MRKTSGFGVSLCVFWIAAGSGLLAQQPYKLPPKEIVDILDAPPLPTVSLNPARTVMALVESESMPSIADVSRPILRIAGLRITPHNNSVQVLRFSTGLSLKDLKTGAVRRIALPLGVKFTSPSWSPDGLFLAFLLYRENGVELWVLDGKAGEARALTGPSVNGVSVRFRWLPDSRRLVAALIPDGRGPAPTTPLVPVGPDIQETSGAFAKTATYQDLLKTALDETLFDYYATAQLAYIDAVTGRVATIGRPGIFGEASPSPDMSYLLVDRVKRPYSHSVPSSGFAHAYEVWDKDGLLIKTLADLPPEENVPMNGVPTGPRSVQWQALKPSTLFWVEALDGGDPEKDAAFRDRLMILASPFVAVPDETRRIQHRYAGMTSLATPGLALVSERDWRKRWQTTWLVDLDHPGAPAKKIFDLSEQDRYGDPGDPVMVTLKNGERVVLQDKDWIYLEGSGASPQGDHPFLDRLNLKMMRTERLFQCQDPAYETFIDFDGASQSRLITSYETRSEPPNCYIHDLKTKKRKALTDFKDPAPQLTGIMKERVRYARDDGTELSGTLYLPAGYQPGTRLPVVIWAYPIEYRDAATAGQVRGSANRFTFYRRASQLFFVTQGYAVLDGAEMPVIGDPKTMNDTYVQQIVANAAAAIRKLDEMGVGDPKRVGVGGHSYGAFMTANLLAHCDLFAAGIARSGAYNRTLTPFGFQSERRTLWEAPETYITVSPFMHADTINEPILLIHGEADNNSGTYPIQSERLFAALKGFGATARLVMLPCESHGYSARESVLDVVAEMLEWFDLYVKNRRN
ncbi:MAG: prolyl oligopeptidase [Candidatus Aminicenantes bacterium RBG_16_63_16]|nr:MAG: prolyl oligopeptidase [Candidatus Aminicenantes bacterium RBG_16_63_16]